MSQDIDISHLKFESRTFPTDADMELWNSLSPAEQRAVIQRDVEEGLVSGTAEIDKDDVMREALNRLVPAAE
ncbi:MAG: hypothetical protein AAF583_02715 [Pseudomonadota bacterium]